MIEKARPYFFICGGRAMSWAGDTCDYNADEIAIARYQLASDAAVEAYGRADELEAKR